MKVLIVEDNSELVNFIKKGLQFENFLVDFAQDGEIALQKIRSNTYDLLIVDLLLPRVDGVELVKIIRDEGNHTPVIILTAICDADTKVKLLNLGADDYIEKPFSFNELRARIRAVLRRAKSEVKNQVFRLGDLVLNPMTREVNRQGKSIRLRKKEFDLLEYLIKHKGEVVNQAVLLENVWDFNANALSNTISTHISSLRRKIDGGRKKKLIKTVHGIGYKLST